MRFLDKRDKRVPEGVLPIDLDPPAKGNRVYYESPHSGHVAGFGVRVVAPNRKGEIVRAFVLNYRHHGAEHRMTIGRVGPWTVAAARAEAVAVRRRIDSGGNPIKERREARAAHDAERSAPTMADLFKRYLEEHADVHKKERSAAEDRGLIHGGAKRPSEPAKLFNGTLGRFFHKMKVKDVKREDVMRFHASLKATPYRANRALALLSKAFNLAEVWGWRPENSNPCRHVQRYREEKRSRYLNPDELGELGKALDASEAPAEIVAAIRLLLLTGCRVSELLGLRWSDVDMKAGQARLEDAKAGARDVQLSTPALAVLSDLPTDRERVFGALSYSALDKAWRSIRKAAGLQGVRLHDLRHTTGTYAGAAGFNAFLIRDLLGHKTLAMTGRYVERHADPVRAAGEAVATQIAAAMRGKKAEVVDLPRKGTG